MLPETIQTDALRLPGVPAGYVVRPFRGEADLPLMTDLINTISRADGHEFVQTLEDMRNQYSHLVNCDLALDFVMVEAAGEPVAYARLWWEIDDEGLLRFPAVINLHPEHRRPTALAQALLRWMEARARTGGDTQPHSGPRVLRRPADRER